MSVAIVNYPSRLPSELLMEVASFLVASELLRLCQVCRAVWWDVRGQNESIVTFLAQEEQRRIQVQPMPFHVQLTLFDVAAHWRQFLDSTVREVRNALSLRQLVFYSGRFDSVLLEGATLVVRDDPEGMSILARQEQNIYEISMLARQEQNIDRALILARSISTFYPGARSLTLSSIALRPGLPILDAYAITSSIPYRAISSVTFEILFQQDALDFIADRLR